MGVRLDVGVDVRSDVGSDVRPDVGSDVGLDINFDILEPPAAQRYSICWVFQTVCHKVYVCICEFVFEYLCILQLGLSVLMSLNPGLFKNIAL